MTSLGEIDEANGQGDAQCGVQSVTRLGHMEETKGPRLSSQHAFTKNLATAYIEVEEAFPHIISARRTYLRIHPS